MITVSDQIEDAIEEIQVAISKIIAEEGLAISQNNSWIETTLRRLENEKVQMRGMVDGLNKSLKFIKEAEGQVLKGKTV